VSHRIIVLPPAPRVKLFPPWEGHPTQARVEPEPPVALVREAYRAAGEKRWPLGRAVWALLLGRHYRTALLGFAYLKCLDALVDGDSDGPRALARLARQRALLAQTASGLAPREDALGPPESWGVRLWRLDRARGGELAPLFEQILATMELDVERRGRALPRERLAAYEHALGAATLGYLASFAAPGRALPEGFVRAASRAYIGADCLLDLREDLAQGLVNAPAEDLARYGFEPAELPDGSEGARRWVAARAAEVAQAFEAAARELLSVEPRRLRIACRLLLAPKQRKFRRFAEGLR
jgi:phytoene/squalene synthetase